MPPLFGIDRPFKPPAYKPKPEPMWATYIQNRSPQWKVHATHGQALQAVKYERERGGVIYKLINDQWLEDEFYEGKGTVGVIRPRSCAECEAQVFDENDYICGKCRESK